MFNFLKTKPVSNNVETKAINNQLTGSVSSIYSDFPSSVYMPSDSASVLNYVRGYAASCINIISKTTSDLPFYLYRIEQNSDKKYIGKSLKVKESREFLKRVNKSIKIGDYSLSKIFEHPFLNVMEKSSINEFFSLITQYILAIGNCYILIKRDSRGMIDSLEILMSEYVSVKFDNNYKIVQYVYQPLLKGAGTVNYTPEDILHISSKTAGSMIVGKGILENALLTVSISEETKKFVNSLLNNSMTPANAIIIKNSAKNETEADRIKEKFITQFGGYNRGKSLITFGEIDIKPLNTNLQDQKVIELNDFCKKEICALFNVPLDLIDTSDSNRATAITAKNNFLKFTVMPLANSICNQITTQLIKKDYDESFMLSYDAQEAMENDPLEQSILFKNYIDMGVLTKEEVRAKLGFE